MKIDKILKQAVSLLLIVFVAQCSGGKSSGIELLDDSNTDAPTTEVTPPSSNQPSNPNIVDPSIDLSPSVDDEADTTLNENDGTNAAICEPYQLEVEDLSAALTNESTTPAALTETRENDIVVTQNYIFLSSTNNDVGDVGAVASSCNITVLDKVTGDIIATKSFLPTDKDKANEGFSCSKIIVENESKIITAGIMTVFSSLATPNRTYSPLSLELTFDPVTNKITKDNIHYWDVEQTQSGGQTTYVNHNPIRLDYLNVNAITVDSSNIYLWGGLGTSSGNKPFYAEFPRGTTTKDYSTTVHTFTNLNSLSFATVDNPSDGRDTWMTTAFNVKNAANQFGTQGLSRQSTADNWATSPYLTGTYTTSDPFNSIRIGELLNSKEKWVENGVTVYSSEYFISGALSKPDIYGSFAAFYPFDDGQQLAPVIFNDSMIHSAPELAAAGSTPYKYMIARKFDDTGAIYVYRLNGIQADLDFAENATKTFTIPNGNLFSVHSITELKYKKEAGNDTLYISGWVNDAQHVHEYNVIYKVTVLKNTCE